MDGYREESEPLKGGIRVYINLVLLIKIGLNSTIKTIIL